VPEDLDKLERLAKLVHESSLCGLGRAAPNPVLSTLKAFRAEYEAHVDPAGRHCPALRCKSLVTYTINDKCVGCTLCAKRCPVGCISGERRVMHVIDMSRCIQCGHCFEVCRFDAVSRN
jgi:formate hydrogenlyase subunit 6/NADH:ubiquinone oxidoreductase subunit I